MSASLKLPVGIESFQEIRQEGFYYIDKTGLIEQLLENWGKVNLFTRPRRFGKTLNMSMLRCFFDVDTDKSVFHGLHISKKKELCDAYMGKFPVIYLSLKGVDGLTFEEARWCLAELLESEIRRFRFLLSSTELDESEKDIYRELGNLHDEQDTVLGMKIRFSLKRLSELLYKHYRKKVIILIDEYDVPLDKAFQHGYYREMVSLIRGLFGETLKTNEFLQFAVLTGCLRVSKESIFTGLNNFKVLSITDARFDEQFGFTEEEVKELCSRYKRNFQEAQAWYDGYELVAIEEGRKKTYSMYSPKSVVDAMLSGIFDNYWNQTETYEALKIYIRMNYDGLKDAVIRMLAGDKVQINTGTFSNDMTTFQGKDDVLTLLVHLGYLSYHWPDKTVTIPNKEVSQEYINAISTMDWKEVIQSVESSRKLLEALWNLDGEAVAKGIDQAHREISVLQYNDENSLSCTINLAFYFAREYYTVIRELPTGKGFADICFIPRKLYADKPAAVIELKWDKDAHGAISQIKEKQYVDALKDYHGNLLLAGINYDKKIKQHTCVIERYHKQ